MRSIRASELQAKYQAILDEVERTGENGTVEILGDVVEPAVPAEDWEAESGWQPVQEITSP